MAFKAGRFNSALQQNRATDTLTLQTIAVLCVTGTEAQLFLKLFTASKKGKREADWSCAGMDDANNLGMKIQCGACFRLFPALFNNRWRHVVKLTHRN